MIVYILGFFVSTSILYYIENKNNRIKYIVGAALSILILCFIAGFRAMTVGTDIQIYALPMFENALNSNGFIDFYNSSFMQAFVHQKVYNIEILYDLLVYVCAKIFGTISSLLFFTQVLVIIPVILSLRKFSNSFPTWLGMLVFDLFYFNFSLNIMRQSIAMGLMLLSFAYFAEKKIFNTIILFSLAFLFHHSIVIMLIVFYIYFVFCKNMNNACNINHQINSRTKRKSPEKKMYLILFIGTLVLFMYPVMIDLLSIIGLKKYIGYLDGGIVFLPMQILLRIPLLVVIILNWSYLKKNNMFYFYVTILLLEILFSQLGGANTQTVRIGYMFGFFKIITIPDLYKNVVIHKFLYRAILIIYSCFYWWNVFMVANAGCTNPYISNYSFHVFS